MPFDAFSKTQGYIEEETAVTDPNSKIYANTNSPPFTQEIFEDVGNAVAVAFLDHIGPCLSLPLIAHDRNRNRNEKRRHNRAIS